MLLNNIKSKKKSWAFFKNPLQNPIKSCYIIDIQLREAFGFALVVQQTFLF